MTTDTFHAERQPNEDVWIINVPKPWISNPVLMNPARIVIPKEHCAELAELLCPKCAPDYAIDFSNRGEPE